MTFAVSPIEIYRIIQTYLSSSKSYKDYRNFLHSSKHFFSAVKYETAQYDIKCKSNDIHRIIILCNQVKNSSKQVKITLVHSQNDNYHTVTNPINDILSSLANGLACLSLQSFPFSDAVLEKGSKLFRLELSALPELVAIPEELIGVEQLWLENSPKLVDISGITKSTELLRVHIFGCDGLSNDALTPLKGIRNVIVYFCNSVTEINNLGNHKSFRFYGSSPVQVDNLKNFSSCMELKIGFASFQCDFSCVEEISESLDLYPSQLKGFETPPLNMDRFSGFSLSLSDFDITNSRLLYNCLNLKELSLPKCRGIDILDFQANLLPAMSLKKLTLANYHEITDVSGMEKVDSLELIGLPSLVSVKGLGKNRRVTLSKLSLLSDFTSLSGVREVKIFSCPGLTDVSFLRDTNSIVLQDCENLSDIGKIERCESLTIGLCQRVQSLTGLRHVRNLSVFGCRGIGAMSQVEYKES
jgi:hypothetical protein